MKVYGVLEKAQIESSAVDFSGAITGLIWINSELIKYADGTSVRTLVNTNSAQTITGKTFSGDDNTFANMPLTAIKASMGSANMVLRRDATGNVVSDKAAPSGDFLGTSDAQVITEKDIDGGVASNTRRMTFPKGTTSALNALTRKEATAWYDSEQKKLVIDDGEFLNAVGSGNGSPSIFGLLQSDGDTLTWFTGNNATFLGAGAITGSFVKQSTDTILSGRFSYKFTLGNVNDYVCSGDVAVPVKCRGNTVEITFPYKFDGEDNSVRVVAYDATNAKSLLDTSFIKNAVIAKTQSLVFNTPTNCAAIRIGFHNTVANSGKVLFFDDIELKAWTPQAVNLATQEYFEAYGNTGTVASSTVDATFTTIAKSTLSQTGTWTGNSTFTAKTNVCLDIHSNIRQSAGGGNDLWIYKNAVNTGIAGDYISSTLHTIHANICLTPNESISIRPSVSITQANGADHRISITATAISENVVQSYAPSDFLGEIKLLPSTTAPRGFIPADGKSIGKTSGNYQGDAYYALYALRWAMASTTAGEPYVISSAKGASAQADWDAGKTITIDVRGMFFRAAGGNAGAVGSKQLDAFQGHKHGVNASGSVGSGIGFTQANNPAYRNDIILDPVTDGTNGTPRTSSETRPINTSEYAYMRYGTSAPDLYALPTSKENRFELVALADGSILKTNAGSLIRVTKTGVGAYTIDYSALGLTASPILKLEEQRGFNIQASAAPRFRDFISVSTTQATVRTGYNTGSTGTLEDAPFAFTLVKAQPDYTVPGVFVGNVAKNQVAKVVYDTSGLRTTLSTSPVALAFNRVSGIHSNIVSLSNSQFTLQQGSYDLDWFAKHYVTSASSSIMRTYLFNVTDSVEVETGSQDYLLNVTGQYGMGISKGSCSIDIASTKTFEIRAVNLAGSTGINFVGDSISAPFSLKAEVKITKLNGQ